MFFVMSGRESVVMNQAGLAAFWEKEDVRYADLVNTLCSCILLSGRLFNREEVLLRVLLVLLLGGFGLSGWYIPCVLAEMSGPHTAQSAVRVDEVGNKRASSTHIGVIMALLATFDEARVLPSEHEPEANQLIHALIQLQSAVVKSPSSAVRQFVETALDSKGVPCDGLAQGCLLETGLTMKALEALMDYGDVRSPWGQRQVAEGFQAYNVQVGDWTLLSEIVHSARERLVTRGETLEEVFARCRSEMSGRRVLQPQETL